MSQTEEEQIAAEEQEEELVVDGEEGEEEEEEEDEEDEMNIVARVRAKTEAELLLEQYPDFVTTIAQREYKLMSCVCDVTATGAGGDKACKAIIYIYEALNQNLDLLRFVIQREVEITEHASTLFRGNSVATRLMSNYAMLVGHDYLKSCLQPILNELVSITEPLEVDPGRAKEDQDVEANLAKIESYSQQILDAMLNSIDRCPDELKRVCALLHGIVAEKFPDNWKVSVAGFMFLRFVCPSIVTPELYQLVDSKPTREARRAMVLVAKVVQNLANGVEFVGKEAYMHALNSFILNNIQTMTDYFETMSSEEPPTDDNGDFILDPIPEDRLDPQTLQTRLLDFYKHLCDNTEKINDYFYPEDEEIESIDYDMVGFTQMLQKTQISNEYQPVTADKEGEQFKEDEAWVLNGDEEWTDPPRPATEVAADLLEQVQIMYMEHSLKIGEFVRGQSADFWELAGSDIFSDFVSNAAELQEVDIANLKHAEKIAFWVNIYNVLVFHIHVTVGAPDSMFARRTFFSVYRYRIGPLAYSLDDMLHGILRANVKKQFGRRDPRLDLVCEKCDPRIHFAVSTLTVSAPSVRIYYPDRLQDQLDYATVTFLRQRVEFKKREMGLPKTFELYRNDFGKNLEEVLNWIEKYLTHEQRETMAKMLEEQNFTVNSTPLNWKNQIFYDLDDGYTVGADSSYEVLAKGDVVLNADPVHDKNCGHPTDVIEGLIDRALSLLNQYAGQSDEIPWAEMAQTTAFKEYLEAASELQQVCLSDMNRAQEKTVFFVNLYHCMVIHYHIMFGPPSDKKKREKFANNYKYMVNMQLFSIADIEQGVLRGNPKNPVTRHRPFRGGDPRRAVIMQEPDERVLLCLSNLHHGCAPIKKYMEASLEVQITDTLIEWCRRNFHWNPSTQELTYPKSVSKYKEEIPQKPMELFVYAQNFIMHIDDEDMAKIQIGNAKFSQESISYEPLPAVDLIQ